MEERKCVIDIGTNSTRLMLATVNNGRVSCFYKTLRTVRTGEGVDQTGRLCEAAIDRTLQALCEYKGIISREAPGAPVLCFATSAVRDSMNREEFCQRVRLTTGFNVWIMTGEEEASCGYLGAIGKESGGIIDIGGGSTEVIFGFDGSVTFVHSFQIGCVRSLERFCGSEEAAFEEAKTLFSSVDFSPASALEFYAIGGTATALAAMDLALPEYDATKVQNYRLCLPRLLALRGKMTGMSFEERARIAGLDSKRSDVIGYGLSILLGFLFASGRDSVIVSDADNMEGSLLFAERVGRRF